MDSRVVGHRVIDGVGRVPGFVNAYTYAHEGETVLIDTGFSSRGKQIVRAFAKAGVPLGNVNRVLLTHRHIDHMGGAAYLLSNMRAPLGCHGEDAPYVDGRAKQPMPLFLRLFARVHPAPVSIVLNDGDQLGQLGVHHTPGHTAGEVVFFERERRILFSGDSVVERKGRLIVPAPKMATNLVQAIQSLTRLRELDAEILLPGHGDSIRKDVRGLLDDLIRRAPREYLGRDSP